MVDLGSGAEREIGGNGKAFICGIDFLLGMNLNCN
jgi:hypothetical protein